MFRRKEIADIVKYSNWWYIHNTYRH